MEQSFSKSKSSTLLVDKQTKQGISCRAMEEDRALALTLVTVNVSLPVYGVQVRTMAASPVLYYTSSTYLGRHCNMNRDKNEQSQHVFNHFNVSQLNMLADLAFGLLLGDDGFNTQSDSDGRCIRFCRLHLHRSGAR